MQNKNAVGTFAILLTIACLYQLSFSWVTYSVKQDAVAYANEKMDSVLAENPSINAYSKDSTFKKIKDAYLLSVEHKEVYPVFGMTYAKCKENEINLGLDLKGGMNVTLEVSVVDVINALSGYSKDPAFVKAIQDAKLKQRNSQESFVKLFGDAFEENNPGARMAAIFHSRENQEKFPRDATNEQILEILNGEAKSAIDRSFNILSTRIDKFGVSQPNIQQLGTSGRILVELPGVKDKERVRKLLQGTANLEFWETYENSEIISHLEEANKILGEREKLEELKDKKDSSKVLDEEGNDLLKQLSTSSTTDTTVKEEATEDLLSKLAGANEDSTVSNDSISEEQSILKARKENPLYAILIRALIQDPNTQGYYPAKGPVVGYAAIKDTAKVMAYLKLPEIAALFPARMKFLWDVKPYDAKGEYLQLYAIKVTSRDGRAPLEGDVITDARPDNDQLGRPEISMSMNADGSKTWRLLTKNNIDKSVAIVLDNYVYSAPTVQNEISGGRSSITGRFTVDEAQDLANILKAGKLPAPARIVEEAVVGPSLGKEAINSGLQSLIIALIIVLLYMIFYYDRAGVVADIALLANMFFIMGVLASMTAALTLPGIAGIVLTIGMSVDANVLIFERIREETAAGKGLRLAIADGYKNAYSSIIDANVTTLLTGIILFIFGTGPIKGFATTLIIGILTSLFSAIFITRMIFEWRASKNKILNFSTKYTEGAFKNINIDFVSKRKLYYIISGAVIVMGIFSFTTRGLNYGVDFKGGRSYTVRFTKNADVKNVRTSLGKVFISEDNLPHPPEVKIFGSPNQIRVVTKYMIDSDAEDADEQVENKLSEGLQAIGDKFEIMSSQKVGPTIADDIKVAAVWAIIFSLIVIFLYILIRFRKWQYGLGALIAMLHDVIIVLSLFSLLYGFVPFSLEIDQAFIAAILTVVGYSINDTVVVFDRIREYLGLHKKKDMKEVINTALNSTLSRTINTSLTTFFVLLMIFIFGGEVIRGFAFALLIGIVVGTYSSICVATPIVIDLAKKVKQ